METERLWTIKDVAQMLGVTTRTVGRYVIDGKIPKPLRIGGAIRWQQATIEQWIKKGCPRSKK